MLEYKIFFISASNLSRSGSNANKNSVNKNINKNKSESLFNNGNNSHVINNNENKNSFNGTSAKNMKNKTSNKSSIDEISPWLVTDNTINKKQDKSKIPMLKTVITTELWGNFASNVLNTIHFRTFLLTKVQYLSFNIQRVSKKRFLRRS